MHCLRGAEPRQERDGLNIQARQNLFAAVPSPAGSGYNGGRRMAPAA